MLKLLSTVLEAGSDYYDGVSKRGAGRFEGQQHRSNAKRRRIAGDREAARYRQAGSEATSNAAAAMAAQGAVIDSEMLARIKRDSDIDAISAMFDAKADALTSEYAARSAEMQGNREYRAGLTRMGSTLLSAASTYKWGGKSGKKSSRPVEFEGMKYNTLRKSGKGYAGGW